MVQLNKAWTCVYLAYTKGNKGIIANSAFELGLVKKESAKLSKCATERCNIQLFIWLETAMVNDQSTR